MRKDSSDRKPDRQSDADAPVALEDDELASVTGGTGRNRSGSNSGVIAGVDWVSAGS